MSCPGKDLYAFIFLRHDMGPRCTPEQEEDQGQGNKMRNHRQYNSGRTRDSFPFRKHPLLISHLAQIFHFPNIKSFPADGGRRVAMPSIRAIVTTCEYRRKSLASESSNSSSKKAGAEEGTRLSQYRFSQ